MKKSKKWLWGLLVLVVLLGALTVAAVQMSKTAKENIIRAMYIPYGENGAYVMVDTENGTVFTVQMPEKIFNKKREQIQATDLQRGNILDVYGNGVMAESYPGQYMGVTEIHVVEEGNPQDADQYQYIIDELYTEPDPAQIPSLTASYRTELAAVSVFVPNGAYSWTVLYENGDAETTDADHAHVLMWEDEWLGDVSIGEPVDVELTFDNKPLEIEVSRWEEQYRSNQEYLDEHPDGEKVEVTTDEEAVTSSVAATTKWILKAEPGYVYRVKGIWENGTVEYGFLTR